MRALTALSQLDSAQSVWYQQTKALADLQDSAVTVRAIGCRSLGKIGDQKSISVLSEILSDSVPAVRVASLAAIGSLIQRLGKQVAEPVIPALLMALSDKNLTVRQQAGQVFVAIGLPAADQVLESLEKTDKDGINSVAVGVLIQMGVPAIEILIGKLDAENEGLRTVVLQVLEILQPDQSSNYRVLKSQADLKDSDPDVRIKGLKQLGSVGALVDGIVHTLTDPEAEVRQQATVTIGQIGDSAVTELLPLLNSSTGSTRWHAIMAVGLIAEQLESDARLQAAVEPLLDALSDTDRSIREVATISLKKIGSSALDQITGRLKSQDFTVRALAENVAIEIAPEQAESIRLNRYIGDLRDQNPVIQSQALLAIRQISDKDIIRKNVDTLVNQHLIGLATDNNSVLELRQSSLLTLADISQKCNDSSFLEPLLDTLLVLLESVDLRSATANVLSQIGKPAVLPLINRLSEQDGQLRSAITKTLVSIDQPAVASLTAALSNPNYQVRRNVAIALGQIDPDHADEFQTRRYINDLQDQNSQVRVNGAKLLKIYGNQNAIEALLAALSDSNYRVRLHATQALAEIGDKNVIGHLDQARKRKEEIKVVKEAMKAAIDHLKEIP